MGVTYASVNPAAQTDGIVYATSVPLTTTEADLWNGVGNDPIQVLYGQAVVAIVTLSPTGGLTAQNTYVVMQVDLGGSTWVDVAWCVYTDKTNVGTFVLSGGVAGAVWTVEEHQASVNAIGESIDGLVFAGVGRWEGGRRDGARGAVGEG